MGSRRNSPRFSSTFSWWATEDGDFSPAAAPISRTLGRVAAPFHRIPDDLQDLVLPHRQHPADRGFGVGEIDDVTAQFDRLGVEPANWFRDRVRHGRVDGDPVGGALGLIVGSAMSRVVGNHVVPSQMFIMAGGDVSPERLRPHQT